MRRSDTKRVEFLNIRIVSNLNHYLTIPIGVNVKVNNIGFIKLFGKFCFAMILLCSSISF